MDALDRLFNMPGDHEKTWCEPCEEHEAHLWSVYGHLSAGGIECLDDFKTESAARTFAGQLLAAHPHLRKFGLLG